MVLNNKKEKKEETAMEEERTQKEDGNKTNGLFTEITRNILSKNYNQRSSMIGEIGKWGPN